MGCADIGSSYAKQRSHVACLGQVGDDGSESRLSWTSTHLGREAGDVLDEHASRSKRANGVSHGEPEAAALTGEPCTSAGVAEVLAGEAAGEPVDGFEFVVGEGADVGVAGPSGVVGGEDGAAGVVCFAGPGGVVPCVLEAEVESPAAGEK